jgi:SpoVK/Ycf46/Vps4 family AAA+-type ATPase
VPTISQLTQLFRSLAEQEHDDAVRLAEQIAATEERRGHRDAARRLRGALVPKSVGYSVIAPQQPSMPALVIRETLGVPLDAVMLRPAARQLLEDIALEWHHQTLIEQSGLRTRRRLLLHGPPGCGKTLTARAMGRLLGIPVFTARMSAIVGSYLGQTGANLRQLFEFAQSTLCVLLLDEFDALARHRGRHDEVGEIDRVVISLLQEFDHTQPRGMIIAATNLGDEIDIAVSRRFDATLAFPLPSRAELKQFALRRAKELHLGKANRLAASLPGLRSFADVESAVINHKRQELLAMIRRGS